MSFVPCQQVERTIGIDNPGSESVSAKPKILIHQGGRRSSNEASNEASNEILRILHKIGSLPARRARFRWVRTVPLV